MRTPRRKKKIERRTQRRFIRVLAAFLADCDPDVLKLANRLIEEKAAVKDPKTYRALFALPKPREGQMSMKVPGEFSVEIYQATRDRWEARYWPNKALLRDIRAGSLDGIKSMVELNFERKIEDWTAYAPDGSVHIDEIISAQEAEV